MHHRTTIPAGHARALGVTLLASERVPPLQATLFDSESAHARPGLERFWGTTCRCDAVVYLILFINEQCLVLALSG